MTVQATFAATLVDEWVRCGVQHAVVAPGSRSTPLALALVRDGRLAVHVHHDERAAAFIALGIAKASGVPAIVLTTSGTAAAELHAAVIEAHQARVPMLVCTADRPPELQAVGAPQTIDQTHLFVRAVRWFAEPGVADDSTRSTWRSIAARAFVEATGPPPGPVHLNLAFRDPLVGEPAALPPGRPDGAPWHEAHGRPFPLVTPELAAQLDVARGLIVAGSGSAKPDGVRALAESAGWPLLADPTSGCRDSGANVIGAFDAILRGDVPEPDVVLRVGDAPASKVLAQWLASIDALQLVVNPDGAWIDADRTAHAVVAGEPGLFCRALADLHTTRDEEWLAWWQAAEVGAQRVIDDVLGDTALTEPLVARMVAAHAETLVVSSSMPVRDVEWYARPRDGLRVLANRGANGIDGVVSTAIGVALASEERVTVLVGDVAFLHDSNALLGLADRDVDLTIVVVNNGGGGIFSFLPQASALPREHFELLFGTPHDVDLVGLAAAHGIRTQHVQEAGMLRHALELVSGARGVHLVLVPTDRHANVGIHEELHVAVRRAMPRG